MTGQTSLACYHYAFHNIYLHFATFDCIYITPMNIFANNKQIQH